MLRRYLLAAAIATALAAISAVLPVHAQPACISPSSGQMPCLPTALNLLPTDILLGTQATGPDRPNETVKIPLSAVQSFVLGGGGGGLSSPPPIGNVTPGTGAFSTLTAATSITSLTTGFLQAGSNVGSNTIVRISPVAGLGSPTISTIGPAGAAGLNIILQSGGLLKISNPAQIINPALIWAGSTAPAAFNTTTVLSGSTTSSTPYIHSETINETGLTSANSVFGHSLLYNYGLGTGGRAALFAQLVQQQGANTDSGADNFYVGITGISYARFPQPGSSATNPLGRIFGGSSVGAVQPGFIATNLYEVAGYESDVFLSNGSSAAVRTSHAFTDLGSFSQGYGSDNQIWIYGENGAGFRYGINFGDVQPWSIDPVNGTILGAKRGAVAMNFATKWGIDLSGVVFPATGNPYDGGLLRSDGISIDGVGTIYQGPCQYSAGSVDCKNSVVTGVAINAPGAGYAPGTTQTVTTAYGGLFTITSNGSGVPTSVAIISPPIYPSTTVPGAATTAVATTNQVLMGTGSLGTGLTLNLTWPANTTLALQPSGGATTVGGTLGVGGGTQNILTITPGATTATAATIGSNTGGVAFTGSGPLASTTTNFGRGGTFTWAGSSLDPSKFGLYANNNCGGTTTLGEVPCVAYITANGMNINAPASLVDVLTVVGVAGGAVAASGGWEAGSFVLNDGAATHDKLGGGAGAFLAMQLSRRASVNQGGTGLTPSTAYGANWGMDITNAATNGATFLTSQNGIEINQSIQIGASVVRRSGLQISSPPAHDHRAAMWDNAILIGTNGASYINGISFGGTTGFVSSFGADSKIITDETMGGGNVPLAGKGIEFNDVTFTTCSICVPGLWVDPAGVTNIGTAFLTPTSAGLEIDAKGSIGTGTPTINSGGSGMVSAVFIADDPYGGVYLMAAAAGAATAVTTVIRQPRYPTTPGPATRVLTARVPEIGTGAILNGTWDSTRTALSIQPTGGPVVMAGLPTSAPATHCALWVNTGVVTRTTCP